MFLQVSEWCSVCCQLRLILTTHHQGLYKASTRPLQETYKRYSSNASTSFEPGELVDIIWACSASKISQPQRPCTFASPPNVFPGSPEIWDDCNCSFILSLSPMHCITIVIRRIWNKYRLESQTRLDQDLSSCTCWKGHILRNASKF